MRSLGVVVCFGCSLLVGCAHVAVTTPPHPSVVSTDSKTEDAWLGTHVVEHVLRLHSLYRQAPDVVVHDDGQQLSLSLKGATAQRDFALPLVPQVLSPDTWVPLVTTIGPPPVSSPLTPAPASLASLLSDLDPLTSQRENLRLSAALRRSVGDPLLHEHAALVLAGLALQEQAARFSDPREVLARLTAHLAFARVLRGATRPSIDGLIAATILAVMTGRQTEALERIDQWKEAEPVWATSLRLLVMRDPRTIPTAPATTSLEQAVRSLVRRTALGSPAPEDLVHAPAWPVVLGRLALQTGMSPVEWRIGPNHLLLERATSVAVWALASSTAAQLDTWPPRDAPPEDNEFLVVSWPVWRDSFVRQVAAAATANDFVRRSAQGLAEAADREAAPLDAAFGDFDVWPAVVVTRGESEQRCTQLASALKRSGLALPPLVWHLAKAKGCRQVSQADFPYIEQFPRGSVFDDLHRAPLPFLEFDYRTRTLDEIQALLALAPYSFGVRWLAFMHPSAHSNTVASIHATFAPLDEFTLALINLEQRFATPDEKTKLLQQACALNIDTCWQVADRLVATEDPGAMPLLERLWKESPGLVASNSIQPLVDMYVDVGKPEFAETIAKAAAQSGSGKGMSTLSAFLERVGRYDEAEQVIQQINERYGGEGLARYYARVSVWTEGKRYAAKGKEALERIMEGPLHKVTLQQLRPGLTGYRFTFLSAKDERFGFKVNDVVVALDGYRVRSEGQHTFVIGLTDSRDMSAIVERDGQLVELKGPYVRWKHGPPARIAHGSTGR